MAYKFNNGDGAIICDTCSKTILIGVLPDNAPTSGEHVCHACGPNAKRPPRKLKKVA